MKLKLEAFALLQDTSAQRPISRPCILPKHGHGNKGANPHAHSMCRGTSFGLP